ncbi:hypothetical protein ACGF5F_29525 [Streptomyces sp. NPDC047821]|uniref:hypothetical protein n=1 Tax=Streptomyces sp. NPDC047821 TaxID=3365488 RepID=UPI00371B5D87
MRDELKSQQEYYSDLCPGPLDDDMTCECDWCDVATDVEVAVSDIADGDAADHMRAGQGRLYLFCPPEGPDVAHWASFADGDRDGCEIAQEQDG